MDILFSIDKYDHYVSANHFHDGSGDHDASNVILHLLRYIHIPRYIRQYHPFLNLQFLVLNQYYVLLKLKVHF